MPSDRRWCRPARWRSGPTPGISISRRPTSVERASVLRRYPGFARSPAAVRLPACQTTARIDRSARIRQPHKNELQVTNAKSASKREVQTSKSPPATLGLRRTQRWPPKSAGCGGSSMGGDEGARLPGGGDPTSAGVEISRRTSTSRSQPRSSALALLKGPPRPRRSTP